MNIARDPRKMRTIVAVDLIGHPTSAARLLKTDEAGLQAIIKRLEAEGAKLVLEEKEGGRFGSFMFCDQQKANDVLADIGRILQERYAKKGGTE
ncbi:hypothetical protein [Zavarzinella formosa]|uniref:hypothetical protein n=1 Tax=Zavarzinella formosa TaxID=360055 RepID=UPI000319F501|nr:hypothetical protein [Zavarzinella formosa]